MYTIFMIAYACEPNRGSEPGVGYEYARALARLTQDGLSARLYTRPHRVQQLQRALHEDLGPHGLTIVPVALPRALWARFGLRARAGYMFWQARVCRRIARDLRGADVLGGTVAVHHVTFATAAVPAWEWTIRAPRQSQVSRLFGPAGGLVAPAAATHGLLRRSSGAIRRAVARKNLARCSVGIANNSIAAEEFEKFQCQHVILSPNAVVDPPNELVSLPKIRDKIVVVGNLEPRKRVHLAVETLAFLSPPFRLHVIGDGPELEPLRSLAASLGLSDRVRFAGRLSRDATLREMATAAVLLHPAALEGSAWVVAEAQAVGTTPVAVAGTGADSTIRVGGLGVVVDEATPHALAAGVRRASLESNSPVSRWSSSRLPGELRQWYELAAGGSAGGPGHALSPSSGGLDDVEDVR